MPSPTLSQEGSGARICPQCEQPAAAGANHCTQCGTALGRPSGAISNQNQDPAANLGAVLFGALAIGAIAYQAWKKFQEPAAAPAARQADAATRSGSSSTANAEPPPKPQPATVIEGWVTGTIALLRLPPQMIREPQVTNFRVNTMPPFYVGSIPIYPPHDVQYSPAEYGPPTMQFVFVIDEYPNGPLTNWASLPERDLDILWRSQAVVDQHDARQDAPAETPQLRTLVDGVVQSARKAGWQPAGHGAFWYSYRLKQRTDKVGVTLKRA
jgi:hypothetical protein